MQLFQGIPTHKIQIMQNSSQLTRYNFKIHFILHLKYFFISIYNIFHNLVKK